MPGKKKHPDNTLVEADVPPADRTGYKVIEQGETVQVIRESDGTGLGAYLPGEADSVIEADRQRLAEQEQQQS